MPSLEMGAAHRPRVTSRSLDHSRSGFTPGYTSDAPPVMSQPLIKNLFNGDNERYYNASPAAHMASPPKANRELMRPSPYRLAGLLPWSTILLVAGFFESASAADRPNVLFIAVDDMRCELG